MKLIHFAKGL